MRKSLFNLLAVLMIVALVVGCQGATPAAPTQAPAATQAPAEEPPERATEAAEQPVEEPTAAGEEEPTEGTEATEAPEEEPTEAVEEEPTEAAEAEATEAPEGDGETTAPAEGAKIAIVSDVGGRGDLSFNDLAFKGGDDAARELGVEVVELVSRTEADYIPNLTTAAEDEDVQLVVAVGFLLSEALAQVAAEYPDKNFAGIDTFASTLTEEPLPNLIDITFEEHKGSALVGALGALLAAHYDQPHIGAVLGIEIPPLWKFEIGYKWGARWATEWLAENQPDVAFEYSPDFVLWTYTGTFDDITKGYEAARAMYEQDAIAVYNVAGPLGLGINQAVAEVAQQEGLESGPPFWIGVDANQDWINPGFVIASMMKRVDQGVFYAAQWVTDGTFRDVVEENGGNVVLGIGTEIGGELTEGISISTEADLEEFVQMGVRAEELTGREVLPGTPEEIAEAVAAMRAAQPEWIWEAIAELEEGIRSGEVEVPRADNEDAIEQWRDELG